MSIFKKKSGSDGVSLTNASLDELKKELKKRGYVVLKEKTSVRFVPCARCGANRRIIVHELGYTYHKCMACGLEGGKSKSKVGAKTAWNALMEDYKSGKIALPPREGGEKAV